jgi:HD superfamily phosphodiesterase
MNTLEKHITQAEQKWLSPLYNFCKCLFENSKMQSHDHTHHYRVWEYSKEILRAINSTHPISTELIEGCLISSLFHDTGLTKTYNENHGKESKAICIQYFEDHRLKKPHNWEEILFAIENHDDKNYKRTNTDPNTLLSILCTADDLDAFGNTGVIRYTEIYLLRGLDLFSMPQLVIDNLNKRFANFKNTYSNFQQLFTEHKKRYLVTREFFENTANELNNSALSS